MRPFPRLSLFGLALLPVLALAACGDDGAPTVESDYPSAGEDRFERTIATVEIDVTLPGVSALPVALGGLETVELEGPMLVLRGDPQDSDGDGLADIETEIVEMTLTGESSVGPLEVRQSPDRRSMGIVEQQNPGQDFPADSFFDVFLEVEILDISLVGYHVDPIRMEAELTDLPPGFRDQYEGALVLPTPLLSADSHVEFALILDALHVPNPPSGTPAASPGATPTAEATPTAAPTEAPTPTPAAEPELELACEHTVPGEYSEIIITGKNFTPGETVEGTVARVPGAGEPAADGVTDFQATAGDDGTFTTRVRITQFGTYQVSMNGVFDIEVTEVCE